MCALFGPCSVIESLVSFLVLQSFCYGRETWLICFECVLAVVRASVIVTFFNGTMGSFLVRDCGISGHTHFFAAFMCGS